MAGHSKFKNIMHRKGAQDKKRAKVFTRLIKEITVAVKMGGEDPSSNPRLRSAILEAKANNMPKDNVERAIKKGNSNDAGTNYEEIKYEGYATAGVAVIVEALTDNKNRTAAEVRSVFTKNGGNLGESGSVSYMFERKGIIKFNNEGLDFDTVMEHAIEVGVDDVVQSQDEIEIITEVPNLHEASASLINKLGKDYTSAALQWIPTVEIEVTDPEKAKTVLKLIQALEDLEDVQNVFANFNISDEILDSLDL